MSNLVIVAIPEADDYVMKLSSEKVPHMTMLFLGDIEGKPVLKIAEFLQHAVSILKFGPFGLSVEYRGVLGADEADVLFFRKDWSLSRIADFRGQLLKDNNIKAAYDSTPQFDGPWQPHLTMGYPATPAKEDKRDYPGINWVQFDRIALWYGDYTGPEFRLSYPDWDEDLAYMSATAGAEFIAHFGVKGMKWGVRKDRPSPDAVPASVASVVRNPKAAKTKIDASGGHNHPATEDALKAAAVKQILKKSGTHAVSTKDLQDLANRLQLEQNVHRLLGSEPKGPGKEFVSKLLKDPNRTLDQFNTATSNVNDLLAKTR